MSQQHAEHVTDTDRVALERELHDALRGELKDNTHYTSNKKFYSIAAANVEFVEAWLRARARGARVLDYCCGDGMTALLCAAAGATVWGIDISPVSVDNARRASVDEGLADRTQFDVMNAEAMTFPDDYFDVIVVNGVLHHLDLERAYPELARVLKADGDVICTEALRHNPFIHTYRKLTPHLRSAWETDHILGKPEIEDARRFFERVEVLRFFHLFSIAAVPFRRTRAFPVLRRALEALDRVALRIPGLRWQAWMAVFVLGRPRKARAASAIASGVPER